MACHVGRAGMHPLKQAILQTTSHVGHSLGGAPIFGNLRVHLGEDGLSFDRAQRRPGAYRDASRQSPAGGYITWLTVLAAYCQWWETTPGGAYGEVQSRA